MLPFRYGADDGLGKEISADRRGQSVACVCINMLLKTTVLTMSQLLASG